MPEPGLPDLTGTVALVTGAGGGIGAGIVRRFAAAGAAVVVHYRTSAAAAENLVDAVVDGGGRAVRAQADLVDPAACAALMELAVERFGRLDAVVANAGVQPVADLTTMTVQQWRHVVDTNLTGTFATVQAAARVLDPGGSITLVGSVEGTQPAPSHAHYAASKAGVIMLARSAALEYGRAGIRANSVSPGLVWRDGLDAAWPDGVERWRRAAPSGRLGRAEDVGNACVFLASEMAAWITGHDLVVDGGMSAHPRW